MLNKTTGEITRNLLVINGKIKKACQLYKKDKSKVNLIAVSKMQPAEKINQAIAQGCRIFGENYIKEAAEKWPEIRKKNPEIKLHFIGHLQSNKAGDAVELFDVIQTLDSEKLALVFQKEITKRKKNPEFFVQVNVGGYDHHMDIKNAMTRTAGRYDQPFSALLTDLKQRGRVDSTRVIWGGEFGRTVQSGGGAGLPGRDHNGKAFSVWMAGGNVKGGQRYGETDETGGKSVKDVVHIHDLHATILRLMGFDHEELIYQYNGRPFRLTDVYGYVVKELIA
jgi:hypothetical protein